MKLKVDRYSSFRNQLLKEREALQVRLARLDGALEAIDGLAGAVVVARRGRLPGAPRRARGGARGKRAKNTMSLKDAVIKILGQGPLTKPEIMDAVRKSGYKFTASNPMNSLNVVLYTKGQFKKLPGKRFAPAK